MKKNCKKLLSIFLQNILYKILFAKTIVRNTYEFYNFIILQRIIIHEGTTCQLKIQKKMIKKVCKIF